MIIESKFDQCCTACGIKLVGAKPATATAPAVRGSRVHWQKGIRGVRCEVCPKQVVELPPDDCETLPAQLQAAGYDVPGWAHTVDGPPDDGGDDVPF